MSSSLGRLLSSIVDPVIDASLVDNTTRLLDVLNGLSPERLHKVLTRTDERGFTPLHLAAERNQPESLKCLLIKDANPNIRSTLTTSEITPLHIAARHGHLASLQLLVQLGGDIMIQDKCHLTPVDYAQINGQDLCFNYLNEVIAQRQAEERTGVEDVLIQVELNLAVDNVQTLNHWKQLNDLFPLTLNTRDPSQLESVMYRHCIIINNRDVVRVLGRICKDIPISLHGASLLHAACRYGRTELTQLLVTKMPEILFSITNEAYNPLHVAVVHQHLEIVKILVSSQSSSFPRTQRGTDAATSGDRDASFSTSLHLQQARFGEPTMSGHTVLHLAVALNNTDIVKVLVRHHRRLKLSCEAAKCGYTALHLAVFLNHTECARVLLKSGANPNASLSSTTTGELTHISRSILSEAVINKNLGLLQTLIDYGGEDRAHSAIKICIPSAEHRRFIIPLLGSLIRLDDGVKLNKQAGRKVKTGVAEWANLQMAEIDPAWVGHAVRCSKFLKMQKIESGALSDHLTTINLSGNSLSWLPPGLFQLGGLQVLNASSNNITGLPDLQQMYNSERDTYEWSCQSLARINLSKNQLTELPHFLFKIPSLTHLDVSHNQLVSLPFDLWSAPKLYQMVGSFNKLEYLPTNWPGVLSTHRVVEPEVTPEEQGEGRERNKGGKGGKRRVVRSGQRGQRPSAMESDSEVQPITRLQDCLNISNSTLPIEWGSGEGREEVYEGLGMLNLSNNLIREIPENFPCLCPKLIRLDLSHNQIRFVSFPYQLPPNLKHISLSYNLLETLNCTSFSPKPLPCTNPLVLADNPTIYRDNVSFCSHRQHHQLTRLSNMEMTNCQLREVNLRVAADTRRRKDGDDSAQQGSSSGVKVQNPEGLVCPLLTRLLLSHNLLSCVPDSVCDMVSLNSLDLSHNDIIELPPQLGRLSNLWEFPLDGLKLISPPHNIIERGKTRDIIGFLWSLLQRARPYHRMKLMLVGKAARGKTTLLSRISEKGQRGLQDNWVLIRMVGAERLKGNLSTVGIVVSDWTYYKRVRESQTNLRSITFMTWDFGGQEEYYATHQCFISRRSLYLVVWNVTHGMTGAEELRPWLLNIQARAPNSPVIIVATHYDKLSFRQAKEECRECQDYIARVYGTPDRQREGFPQIMRSMTVSCKNGRGINELRDALFDVASQVKENTVAGRGIGCGRIPDYRLLMDQLVPASYLQLEDTVRNLAIQMKHLNKPPVLSYKELRELVFGDTRTLISRHSADRELEQAVRFLHDNGTLLHYEDPLLADFYFVDPQWLCDMLAHIITVREINPFVREGVMRIADFPLIFNTGDFPMRWKREYIRLLTTFEVAVELSDGELLIPSTLPCERPNLPQNVFPSSLRVLPPLRHAYIIPFVPSGFWPRLMSRVLSDKTIIQLARDGCNIEGNDVDQLSWVKWREGLILQYGNLNLMTIEELKDSLFPNQHTRAGVKIFKDGHWDPISSNTKISGISVTVPDYFPILKFLEHSSQRKTGGKPRGPSSSSLQSTSSAGSLRPIPGGGAHSMTSESNAGLPLVPEVNIETSSEMVQSSGSHDSGSGSHDRSCDCDEEGSSGANRVVEIDKIEEEVQRLARRCKDRCRLLSCNVSSSPRPTVNWGGPSEDGTVPSGNGLVERPNSFNLRRRVPSNEMASPRHSMRSLSRGSQSSTHDAPPTTPQPAPPVVEEEAHDKMRAGLISKAVDHITLLVEDWFTGVKPRYHLVPCPHCASRDNRGEEEGCGPQQVPLLRSFSAETSLQTPPTQGPAARKPSREKRPPPGETRPHPLKATPPLHSVAPATTVPSHKSLLGRISPWRPGGKPQIGAVSKPPAPSPGQYYVDSSGNRYLVPERDQRAVQDPYNYAFRYDDCVVLARSQDFVTCPAHGKILLRYMSPDTLFVAQGKEILVSGDDCVKEGVLGQGAYATVFQVRIRKNGESEPTGPFALKALTKEWTRQTTISTTDPAHEQEATPPKPPSRYSIIQGFNNLKKELALLSPLRNPHVIQLHGVVLRPLGLILEHAPGGSLKKTLEQFHELQQHLRGNVVQAVIIQVAQAIRYLHDCSIIYRDLKSDNVLVWRFPMPHDSVLVPQGRLGLETVLVKLSDLGISQFAATQGARGLVGTPGYMAPEILKYHGKEVYSNQVDIFSFGMFMYELLTLHIPYENLTAQQANQANESGSRPALTRKDLECAVLLRELMVWCWQQHPDHRPSADDIISTAQSEQFLRLLNGIRVSRGQVTAACVSLSLSSSHSALTSLHHHRQKSPRPPIHTDLANPFVPDRQSTDGGLHWLDDSRLESHPDAVLLSGVKMHQDSVETSQYESSSGQVGDVIRKSEHNTDNLIEVQIEPDLTRSDTGDAFVQPTDSSDTFGDPVDTGDTFGDPTDTGNTPDDPTDTGDTPDDPTDTGDTPDDPTDTGETPDDPTDTGDTPDDPTDTGETPDDPTDTGETPDDPTDTGDTPDHPTDTGDTPDHPTDTCERQRRTSISGTSDTGFSSKLCTTSEPDSTPPPPYRHQIATDHVPSNHTPSDHTPKAGGSAREPMMTISDCYHPSVLINQFSETERPPSPHGPPHSWSPTPQRPLSTPAKFPSPDPQASPCTKFSFPGPQTHRSLEPHPPIRVSSDSAGSRLSGSKVAYSQEGKRQERRGWSEEREEELVFSPSVESLSGLSEEEAGCEVWVASCDAHRAVLSVVGYCGQFTSLEEMDMGDSPILALCAARGRVWVGFQIGHLLIFDSSSHHLLAQIWLRQYTPIVSIVHVPHHRRVFVTLATGSVFAYKDEVEGEAGVRRMPLQPVCEYHDLGQPASCVTAVPRPPGEVGGTSHELWVGQSEAMITILDPRDLSVVKFLRNTSDKSPTPSYMAYLTYTNLVYSSHLCTVTQTQTSSESGAQDDQKLSVSVYGALRHGQCVTQWNAGSKEVVACHDCKQCCKDKEDCKISSLHCHTLQLLVGLCSGKILVLDALTFSHLSSLTCHRGPVQALFTLSPPPPSSSDTSSRYASPHWTSAKKKSSRNSFPDRPSLGSMSLPGSQPNSADPSPIPTSTPYSQYSENSILSNSQSTSSSGSDTATRLLSFGSGFRSYYDGPESVPHLESGFVLVWDLPSSVSSEAIS